MRRIMSTGALAGLALVAVASATAHHRPGHPPRPAKIGQAAHGKVRLCHRGHTIRVSMRAVPRHVRHGDRIGRCAAAKPPRRFALLRADLDPVAGATGHGTAVIAIGFFPKATVFCYGLRVSGVAATAAHVHTAVAQTIGGTAYAANAIVVPLETPNANGVAQDCTVVPRAISRALATAPASFYVNVHSAAFPGGQIQGTLTRTF
jgi:hypothetical protein